MKTKDVKDEILRRTDNGRQVFEHYSGGKKPKKNFLNPEYYDTKPSCSYFFSEDKHIYLYKDQGGDIRETAFALPPVALDWIAGHSSVRCWHKSIRI